MHIGQIREFRGVKDQFVAEKYLSTLQKEIDANSPKWELRYWKDETGHICAMRVDGLSPEEIEERQKTSSKIDPRGNVLIWCPVTWNEARDTPLEPLELKKKLFAGSQYGWEKMDVNARELIRSTWPNLRHSIATQMIRRNLRWTFSIRERPDLSEGKPGKNSPRWFEVMRIN